MHRPTRAPNPADGSPAVTEESGGDPAPPPQSCRKPRGTRSSDRPGGGEPPHTGRARVPPLSGNPCASQPPYRRTSSGYFSYEGCGSAPSSPLSPQPAMADKATQTPSLTAQALTHALRSAQEASRGAPGTHHGNSPSPSSMRQRQAAGVMQEEEIARHLRHIGDELNERIIRRARPPLEPEPFHIICMGLLLFVIGRYLQDL